MVSFSGGHYFMHLILLWVLFYVKYNTLLKMPAIFKNKITPQCAVNACNEE